MCSKYSKITLRHDALRFNPTLQNKTPERKARWLMKFKTFDLKYSLCLQRFGCQTFIKSSFFGSFTVYDPTFCI